MSDLRPSIRFHVFKRDDFTCTYCGRRPPDVTLEVDHIIPKSQGGTNDPENLTTSCWDCNRGKGGIPLDVAPAALGDLDEKAALIRERERQLRAYNEAAEQARERRERDFLTVWEYWYEVWGEEELYRWHVPWESTLRKYVDTLGTAEVMDAMDVARARFQYLTTNAVRYFVGVLKRKAAQVEGASEEAREL